MFAVQRAAVIAGARLGGQGKQVNVRQSRPGSCRPDIFRANGRRAPLRL
jgi:hypothetical protein